MDDFDLLAYVLCLTHHLASAVAMLKSFSVCLRFLFLALIALAGLFMFGLPQFLPCMARVLFLVFLTGVTVTQRDSVGLFAISAEILGHLVLTHFSCVAVCFDVILVMW